MDDTPSDYDGAWKEALGGYFADFMAFFFPPAHAEIDSTTTVCLTDTTGRWPAWRSWGTSGRDGSWISSAMTCGAVTWASGFRWSAARLPAAVINLFRFIDWLMQLPEELEEGFWQEMQAYEEAKQMPYITSVERIGIKKGIQQGEALVLRHQLLRRFGTLPGWVEERLAQAHPETLEQWAERILEARTIEEIFEGGGSQRELPS